MSFWSVLIYLAALAMASFYLGAAMASGSWTPWRRTRG